MTKEMAKSECRMTTGGRASLSSLVGHSSFVIPAVIPVDSAYPEGMRRPMLPVSLQLTDLVVRYGPAVAVDGVTLHVRRGEIVALIGPNGSGKSTTLAVAAGVREPTAGTVSIDGITRSADPTGFARKVGLVPQGESLYDELSAAANLTFFAKLYGFRGPDLNARVIRGLARANLPDREHDRVGTLSGGMKQRLGIACALLHDPPVLLLDEPTAALDPASRDALLAHLHRLRDDGHAVLFTTHHLDEAEHACDRVATLVGGKLTSAGPPADVLRRRGRAVLYGHLRDRLPRFVERGLRERLGPAVEVEFTGRRVRLAAASGVELGRALAVVLSEGAEIETFRTAPVLKPVRRQET
jgi:ABC-2 type transport system ATP-binding protein